MTMYGKVKKNRGSDFWIHEINSVEVGKVARKIGKLWLGLYNMMGNTTKIVEKVLNFGIFQKKSRNCIPRETCTNITLSVLIIFVIV